jgi:hypothetical protein
MIPGALLQARLEYAPVGLNTGIPLSAKERKDQAQHDADDDAGDDWEIENRVSTLDADVARKFPEDAGADSGPENYPKDDDANANNDQKFPELWHVTISHRGISVARRLTRRHSERQCWSSRAKSRDPVAQALR